MVTNLCFQKKPVHTHSDCKDDKTLLADRIIQENINSLAVELNLEITSTPKRDVSDKTLQAAVEMFTYLNFCPHKLQYFPKHSALAVATWDSGHL